MRFDVSVAKAQRDLQNPNLRRVVLALSAGAILAGAAAPAHGAPLVSTGECAANCCPPDGSGANLPAMMGRRVPGYADANARCGESAISLVNAAVGAGATATLTTTAQMTLCVTSVEIVSTGAAGFSLSTFTINNEPQWQLTSLFHSDMFAPGSDNNTAFRGDCVQPGSIISMVVTNLDAINARGIFVALRGPAAR